MVGILGILGNVAAITVFARQHLQKNFHGKFFSASVANRASRNLIFLPSFSSILVLDQFSVPVFKGVEQMGVYIFSLLQIGIQSANFT